MVLTFFYWQPFSKRASDTKDCKNDDVTYHITLSFGGNSSVTGVKKLLVAVQQNI